MESSPSSMDWQQDTPPAVYIAPTGPFQSSSGAIKRSFENYSEDYEAAPGPEAVVEDSRYARVSEDRLNGSGQGLLDTEIYDRVAEGTFQPGIYPPRQLERDDFHSGTHLNDYSARNDQINPQDRPQTTSSAPFTHQQPQGQSHAAPFTYQQPQGQSYAAPLTYQQSQGQSYVTPLTHHQSQGQSYAAPFTHQQPQGQSYAAPAYAWVDPYIGRPLVLQYSVRACRLLAKGSVFMLQQAQNLPEQFVEVKEFATTTTRQIMNLKRTTQHQVRNLATTTASTLSLGTARAKRLAQRNRRRAHDVYTCAVQTAQAAKRRCMQFTIIRREPAPVARARRRITPPATPQQSPRRSPSHFTSGRINAENDASAKKAAASIKKGDWLANFLPTPSITDLQLQQGYEIGDDDIMDDDDFMDDDDSMEEDDLTDEAKSVNIVDHMQSSPLSEIFITSPPVAVSPIRPITYSPATGSSTEPATSLPVVVSSVQPLAYSGTPFSFTVPTADSALTAPTIHPIACSPTTFSLAAPTTDSPVTVSDASLSELFSPAAVPSARKSTSPATHKKKSPGMTRHSQKTAKKSVGFFASPRTGKPVSRIKKYIKGEPIDFPVDTTPGTATTISSCSSDVPVDTTPDTATMISSCSSDFPVDTTPGAAISSCSSSFLRQHKSTDSPVILEDTISDSSSLLGFSHYSDLAVSVDNTTDSSQAIQSFGSSNKSEEPENNANENLNVHEHQEAAVTAHQDILRPIQNGGTVITRPRSPTKLFITELGSPIKAAPTLPAPSPGDEVTGEVEIEVLAASEQHDEGSNKENDSPSTAQADQFQHTEAQSTLRSSPQPEQIFEQPTPPTREPAAQGAQPSDGPVTPVRLKAQFSSLSVSGRRSSSRQQLRREAEEHRKAAQAAKEAEEKAAREEAEEEARKAAEEERQKKLTRRIPIEKVIQPLSPEWEDKVIRTMALADNLEVATTSTGTKLLRRDLGTLLPQDGRDSASGWLNDEIIAAYLQAVVDHGLAATDFKKGQTPKYYAFNTFFYKNIRDKGPDSVKRWATKAKIGGKNLESVERVLIPVHEGAHWTLLVVSPVLKTIEYFDSLGGPPDKYVRNAKAWLAQELGRAWIEADWQVVASPSPRQDNGKDCGVFTVTTAKMVVLGLDPLAYGCADIPLQRRRMVAELLHGGFTGEFAPRV